MKVQAGRQGREGLYKYLILNQLMYLTLFLVLLCNKYLNNYHIQHFNNQANNFYQHQRTQQQSITHPQHPQMSQVQQYQLKLAVSHHKSLKTQQLIQFLQNQSNSFLSNDFPLSLTQDRFITIFQPLSQPESNDFSQYVGLLLLYSSSSIQSFEFMKKNIPKNQSLADLFMIIVQMDNSDKKTNAIGDQGERLCQKNGYQFVRLTLYNSQDLVACLQKNLYELIENYYYPNQQEKPSKKNYQSQYLFHYGTQQKQQPNLQQPITQNYATMPNNTNINANINTNNSSPIRSQQKSKIIATKEQKKSIQKLLQKASQLRESRHQQIMQQQKQIDQSIANVQKILGKINEDINSKVKSSWYTTLNHTLYSPLQKNSISYAKIKLTQEFVDDDEYSEGQGSDLMKLSKKRSLMKSQGQTRVKFPAQPERTAIVNKFIAKHRKLQPVMRLVLVVAQSVIVELDVFQQSQYDELAMIAIKKLGITESQHNYRLMKKIIQERIQNFIKELTRAVRVTQKTRIDQRSFLKPANSNSNKNLYKSNASSFSQYSQS